MSERGSFVTEYIYCPVCFKWARKVLCENHKYLKGVVIPSWDNGVFEELPIIAGKVGGLYESEEIVTFEIDIIPELKKGLCHPMRIAVIAETGQRIFYL